MKLECVTEISPASQELRVSFYPANTSLFLASCVPFPAPLLQVPWVMDRGKESLEVIIRQPTQAMSEPKGMGLAYDQDRTEPRRGAE